MFNDPIVNGRQNKRAMPAAILSGYLIETVIPAKYDGFRRYIESQKNQPMAVFITKMRMWIISNLDPHERAEIYKKLDAVPREIGGNDPWGYHLANTKDRYVLHYYQRTLSDATQIRKNHLTSWEKFKADFGVTDIAQLMQSGNAKFIPRTSLSMTGNISVGTTASQVQNTITASSQPSSVISTSIIDEHAIAKQAQGEPEPEPEPDNELMEDIKADTFVGGLPGINIEELPTPTTKPRLTWTDDLRIQFIRFRMQGKTLEEIANAMHISRNSMGWANKQYQENAKTWRKAIRTAATTTTDPTDEHRLDIHLESPIASPWRAKVVDDIHTRMDKEKVKSLGFGGNHAPPVWTEDRKQQFIRLRIQGKNRKEIAQKMEMAYSRMAWADSHYKNRAITWQDAIDAVQKEVFSPVRIGGPIPASVPDVKHPRWCAGSMWSDDAKKLEFIELRIKEKRSIKDIIKIMGIKPRQAYAASHRLKHDKYWHKMRGYIEENITEQSKAPQIKKGRTFKISNAEYAEICKAAGLAPDTATTVEVIRALKEKADKTPEIPDTVKQMLAGSQNTTNLAAIMQMMNALITLMGGPKKD